MVASGLVRVLPLALAQAVVGAIARGVFDPGEERSRYARVNRPRAGRARAHGLGNFELALLYERIEAQRTRAGGGLIDTVSRDEGVSARCRVALPAIPRGCDRGASARPRVKPSEISHRRRQKKERGYELNRSRAASLSPVMGRPPDLGSR